MYTSPKNEVPVNIIIQIENELLETKQFNATWYSCGWIDVDNFPGEDSYGRFMHSVYHSDFNVKTVCIYLPNFENRKVYLGGNSYRTTGRYTTKKDYKQLLKNAGII